MKKIALITINFPPINSSSSIRAVNYANYMAKLGNEVVVFTVEWPESFANSDLNSLKQISDDVEVVRVSPGRIYKNIVSNSNNEELNISPKQRNIKKIKPKKLISELKKIFKTPDSYWIWQYNSRKNITKMHREKKFDIVFSMHESPSAHLLAKYIKRKNPEIKWIAFWGDPWTIDPLREKEYNFLKKYIEKSMEKKVAKLADKHLFTTKQCLNQYEEMYDIKDTDIVYRGYEKNISFKKNNSEKIKFIHAGEIYTKLRNVQPLIDAVEEIKKTRPKLYRKIQLLLLGGIDSREVSKQIKDKKLEECIKILPRVGYEEANKYISESDVLLLFGNKKSPQIPGKIFDYLGFNKPILTILGDENDTLLNFYSEFKIDRGPVVKNSTLEIFKSLENIVELSNSNELPRNWSDIPSRFEWENVTEDLLEKIN